MTDRERVITGLEIILNGCDEIQCEDCCFHIKEPTKPRRCGIDEEQIQEEALALLKEQEEQKQKWLQSIADNQLANAPKDSPMSLDEQLESEYKSGIFDGLQMAFDILTEGL